jgi:hypothetical protein
VGSDYIMLQGDGGDVNDAAAAIPASSQAEAAAPVVSDAEAARIAAEFQNYSPSELVAAYVAAARPAPTPSSISLAQAPPLIRLVVAPALASLPNLHNKDTVQFLLPSPSDAVITHLRTCNEKLVHRIIEAGRCKHGCYPSHDTCSVVGHARAGFTVLPGDSLVLDDAQWIVVSCEPAEGGALANETEIDASTYHPLPDARTVRVRVFADTLSSATKLFGSEALVNRVIQPGLMFRALFGGENIALLCPDGSYVAVVIEQCDPPLSIGTSATIVQLQPLDHNSAALGRTVAPGLSLLEPATREALLFGALRTSAAIWQVALTYRAFDPNASQRTFLSPRADFFFDFIDDLSQEWRLMPLPPLALSHDDSALSAASLLRAPTFALARSSVIARMHMFNQLTEKSKPMVIELSGNDKERHTILLRDRGLPQSCTCGPGQHIPWQHLRLHPLIDREVYNSERKMRFRPTEGACELFTLSCPVTDKYQAEPCVIIYACDPPPKPRRKFSLSGFAKRLSLPVNSSSSSPLTTEQVQSEPLYDRLIVVRPNREALQPLIACIPLPPAILATFIAELDVSAAVSIGGAKRSQPIKFECSKGRARFDAQQQCLIWRMDKLAKHVTATMRVTVSAAAHPPAAASYGSLQSAPASASPPSSSSSPPPKLFALTNPHES